MKRETAVEFLIENFDLEMQDTFHLDKINQAKEMEKNQKMDFANWCRIHDSKYPNTVMTIQQLYDKYEQELGSELESGNSSERKNTLSDYGVAGEDNSMEYANEENSLTNALVQEEQPQPNTPELENNPEPSTPKVRIQTALDIFELEEWRLEAFGIRTPTEFEEYREQRKQLYDKCRNIERMEQEKLIREACTICTKALMAGDNTTVEEVVNQVLNRSNN